LGSSATSTGHPHDEEDREHQGHERPERSGRRCGAGGARGAIALRRRVGFLGAVEHARIVAPGAADYARRTCLVLGISALVVRLARRRGIPVAKTAKLAARADVQLGEDPEEVGLNRSR